MYRYTTINYKIDTSNLLYIGMYTYIQTYIHTYIRTYVHTYIYTYTYILMCAKIHIEKKIVKLTHQNLMLLRIVGEGTRNTLSVQRPELRI